ncbi:hypothetical protein AWB91_08985 [Mycobacterium paraense]|uniref:DUF732 domain-containing protein n=1 Tax=Mycobacterium paraense TaxID=767916 RepID=A0ABX3VSD3_9MYCO|nr:hypothetical protein AWB91_08985 [Mycobacterium paraense]ORW34689.1 hypothetical protein AWB88_02795 [Mycobacterium paraense]
MDSFRADVTNRADLHMKGGDEGARRIAAEICVDLAGGRSIDAEASALGGRNMSVDQAKALVEAAAYHFCPTYYYR